MTYRDETEGLRTRVADLEAQLAEAQGKVARLTGEGPRVASGDQIEASGLIGASTRVVCERVLDFEIEDETFERIAEAVRLRLPVTRQPPNVAQVGRTLQAPGFFLESREGRTRLRMEGDFRGLLAGAISCAGLGGGFVALVAFAIAHDAFLRTLSEAHVLWMIPLAVIAFFPVARRIAATSSRKQEAHLKATFETVLEIARQGARSVGASTAERVLTPPVRIATGLDASALLAAAPDAASTGVAATSASPTDEAAVEEAAAAEASGIPRRVASTEP